MKVFTFLTLGLMLSISVSATNPVNSPDKRCRQMVTDNNQNLTLAQKVELDLMEGIWSKESETGAATLSFREFGALDKMTATANGNMNFESCFWKIETYGGKPFLVMSDPNCKEETIYKTEQTCEGMILTDISTEKPVLLKYVRKASAKTLATMRTSLSGKWASITYPFDITKDLNRCGTFEEMKDAYLTWEFRPDGKYVKHMGTAKLDIEETGVWEISENGKFLVLRPVKDDANPETSTGAYIAEVAHLDTGEMVLKHALQGGGDFETLFCTEVKTFYFNKG